MTYFKVKPTSDNKKRYTTDKRTGRRKYDGIWIANELYTPGEIKHFVGFEEHTEQVQVKKTDCYWCFGARFAACKGGDM